MDDGRGPSSSLPSLPQPRLQSPPVCPDLYGRRREIAKLQLLERERSFLEGELKFIEGLQPASRCCKEVVESVGTKSDPFIPIHKRIDKQCRLWKWICKSPCILFSWICCCTGCSIDLKMPNCRCCINLCNCGSCTGCCSLPKLRCNWCLPCFYSCCCRKISCPKYKIPCTRCKISCPGCTCNFQCPNCKLQCPNCTNGDCCGSCCTNACSCSCPNCTQACCCLNCGKHCCVPPCCLCF